MSRNSCRVVSLIITHNCNLDCVYCYERFKAPERMMFSDAQKIIQQEFEYVRNSSKFQEMRIEFFGGEPLMEFELIRQIVEWCTSQNWGIPCHFFVVTNGTLLTEEMKTWFSAHRDSIILGLSFDGTPQMQDQNRSQSFQQVDLEFFLKNYPKQSLKMTISENSMKNFAEGVLYLQKMGFIVEPSCGCGVDWNEQMVSEYEKQLYILANTYLEDETLIPISLLTQNFIPTLLPPYERAACGAGDGFETYDIDGKRYPCHMFTPLVQERNVAERFADSSEGVTCEVDAGCTECILQNICDPCRGYSLSLFGSCSTRDWRICRLFLSQCRVSAWYQVRKFQKRKERGEAMTLDDVRNMEAVLHFLRHPDKVGKK